MLQRRKKLNLCAGLALIPITIGFLVAPSSAADDPPLPVPTTATTQGRTMASYLHDVSQPIPGVSLETAIVEHHRVQINDTVTLDTWVARPNIPGKVPVVVRLTPYYAGGSPQAEGVRAFHPPHLELLKRGYAIVVASMRGTGNSSGCFTIGGSSEARDSAAVIDYYGTQPWSNGNVGAIGASYDGTAPQDLWVQGSKHLKTIVPVSAISDMYKYSFINGVPFFTNSTFNAYYWILTGLSPLNISAITTDPKGSGNQASDQGSLPAAVIGEACTDRLTSLTETAASNLDGNKDDFWKERDFGAELRATPDKARASVLYIHGLDDWNVKTNNMDDWLGDVQDAGVPYKVMLGQWPHAFPTRADWNEILTAWFDRWLKDRNTGIMSAPKVQVQDSTGAWRHEDRFPAATGAVTLYPAKNPTLVTALGALGTAPATGLRGGSASFFDYAGTGALTQGSGAAGTLDPLTGQVAGAINAPDRITFTSAPVAKDVRLSGSATFDTTVTASGARATLVLSLGSQAPDGTITYLDWAIQSLNHIADLSHGKDSIAGLAQKARLRFLPQDLVIPAGHRLVLTAAGLPVDAPKDLYVRPQGTGSTISLNLGASTLRVPVDSTVSVEPTP